MIQCLHNNPDQEIWLRARGLMVSPVYQFTPVPTRPCVHHAEALSPDQFPHRMASHNDMKSLGPAPRINLDTGLEVGVRFGGGSLTHGPRPSFAVITHPPPLGACL